jgi:hypothetical protein
MFLLTTIIMSIKARNDLIGVNSFCKMFSLDRKAVQRMIDRGFLDGISIRDGNVVRYFIDLGLLMAEARDNDTSTAGHVAALARQSRR